MPEVTKLITKLILKLAVVAHAVVVVVELFGEIDDVLRMISECELA